jgi:ribosomal protein S7
VSFAKEINDKQNKTIVSRLATEIMNAYNNTGKSVEAARGLKSRAEENKAFVVLK